MPKALSGGHRALITGSVQGIGLSVASAFASQGVSVFLTDIAEPANFGNIAGELRGRGAAHVGFYAADLTDEHQIRCLVDATVSSIGAPDILINNAAARTRESIESIQTADWYRAVAVNLSAPFHLIRATLPFMRRQGWGRIVNVASGFGLIGSARRVDYVGTKFGMVGLTKAVALDLMDSGITCNAVCPGATWTPRQEERLANIMREGHSREEAYERLLQMVGTRRFLSSESIADAVAYLCRESSSAITGVALPVDGGDTAGW